MDINEALQVVNNLFDYLSEIGELDKEDFHRMNEAEDVINNYVRKTAAAPNTIHFIDGSWATPVPDPCKNCPTHPSNGGNGMCNCTLGLPEITC